MVIIYLFLKCSPNSRSAESKRIDFSSKFSSSSRNSQQKRQACPVWHNHIANEVWSSAQSMLALQYGNFGTKYLNLEPEDTADAAPSARSSWTQWGREYGPFSDAWLIHSNWKPQPQAVLKVTLRLEWNGIAEASNVYFFSHTLIFKGVHSCGECKWYRPRKDNV